MSAHIFSDREFATAGSDRTVRIWERGKPYLFFFFYSIPLLLFYPLHSSHILDFFGLFSERRLICCLRFIDFTSFIGVGESPKLKSTLTGHVDWVRCVKVNDSTIVSGGCDKNVILWDRRAGTIRKVGLNSFIFPNLLYLLSKGGVFIIIIIDIFFSYLFFSPFFRH